jgi:hypothetical protein
MRLAHPARFIRFFAATFLALAALFTTFLTTSVARAQSVTVTGTIERRVASGSLAAHPGGIDVKIINYSDCASDEYLHVPLTLSGIAPGNTIEAWAGEGTTDCTNTANRTAGTIQCWRVGSGPGTTQTTALDLRAQDIMSQFGKATKEPNPAPGTSDICNSASIAPGPHNILVSIFFINGQTGTGTAATLPITVAMQAPAITGTLTIEGADTIAKVTLPNNADTSIKGYDIYCDPPTSAGAVDGSSDATSSAFDGATQGPQCAETGAPAVVDSGADGNDGAATDASSTSTSDACGLATNPSEPPPTGGSATCSSSVLIPGGGTTTEAGTTGVTPRPPPPGTYKCGHVDGTSSSVTVTGLANNVHYAMAAATTDIYGNVGPLSALKCVTPQPVDDFWKLYKGAGGGAGGDFCALEAAGMPAGTTVFGASMMAALVALVRRRRRS